MLRVGRRSAEFSRHARCSRKYKYAHETRRNHKNRLFLLLLATMPGALISTMAGLAIVAAAGTQGAQAVPHAFSHRGPAVRSMRPLSAVHEPLRFDWVNAIDREFERMDQMFADLWPRGLHADTFGGHHLHRGWPRPSSFHVAAPAFDCQALRKAGRTVHTPSPGSDSALAHTDAASEMSPSAQAAAASDLPDAYLITTEVPGFQLSDLAVTVKGRTVRIDGRKTCDRATNPYNLPCSEREIHKSALLPGGLLVDMDSARASLDSGVLYVEVPVRPVPVAEDHNVAISAGLPDLSGYRSLAPPVQPPAPVEVCVCLSADWCLCAMVRECFAVSGGSCISCALSVLVRMSPTHADRASSECWCPRVARIVCSCARNRACRACVPRRYMHIGAFAPSRHFFSCTTRAEPTQTFPLADLLFPASSSDVHHLSQNKDEGDSTTVADAALGQDTSSSSAAADDEVTVETVPEGSDM